VTPTQIFMFAQDALRTLAFHRLFEEETFRQERRSDVLDVLRRYAADVEMVSPSSDSRYDFVDFYSGRLDAESEALALGKQVVDARRASISSDRHREVAAFEADQRHRHEIVCRRQAPAMRAAARRLPAETAWQRQAVDTVVDDLFTLQAEIASHALQVAAEAPDPLAAWTKDRTAALALAEAIAAELRAGVMPDLAMLVVASRQLREALG